MRSRTQQKFRICPKNLKFLYLTTLFPFFVVMLATFYGYDFENHHSASQMTMVRDPPELIEAESSVSNDNFEFYIQRLAWYSWSRVSLRTYIRIWMDTDLGCARAGQYPELKGFKCTPIPKVHEESGRPYLNTLWLEAKNEYRDHILVWLNGDLIVTDMMFHRISSSLKEFPSSAVVSRRTDFNITEDWAKDYNVRRDLNPIISKGTKEGALHDATGIDVFAFSAQSPIIDNIPPFVIGAYRWDNWLVYWSLRERIPVIDISGHGLVLHTIMNRNMLHHAMRIGANYNDALCKKSVGELYKMGIISNADYMIEEHIQGDKLVRNGNQSISVALARRAGPAGWLAVVTVNKGYMDLAYQWLCHVRRIGIQYYVFLAQDPESFAVLKASNEAVIHADNFDLSADLSDISLLPNASSAADYGSLAFQQTMTLRTLILKKLLAFGFHVITADLDSIWLNDPLQIFDDIATVQGQEHKDTKISGGFVAIRSGPVGRQYWQRVYDCQQENMKFISRARPGSYSPSKYTEQECVNDEAMFLIKRNTSGFSVRLLQSKYFPDGLSFFTNFLPARQGVLPFVIHNNWVVGTEEKLARLRNVGLYFEGSDLSQCPHHPLKPDLKLVPTKQDKIDSNEDNNSGEGGIKFRVHILTMSRPASLRRLLDSLKLADYAGYSISLIFFVDKPSDDEDQATWQGWRETLKIAQEFRLASHVKHKVVEHGENRGLLGQWLDTWSAQDPEEVLIVFEDDLQVSPHWFARVTQLASRYYRTPVRAGGDPSLAGFSLQRQHTILGERPDLRYGSATPQSLLDPKHQLFRYQLPSTWGSIWFPHAWSAFQDWLRPLHIDRAHGNSSSTTPCVPTLISNSWWKSKPSKIWSVWIIRFFFERGFYFLYTNFLGQASLVVNYRESGLHFKVSKGADTNLTDSAFHTLPDLADIPLYDLHFRQVPSAESLRWNAPVLSPVGLDRCVVFNKTLAKSKYPVFGYKVNPPQWRKKR